ncbi:MAG TPA: D-alanyl-D-alanine carboxypeptidase family protein, partial [Candidatus Paceibacterota bacterium]
MKVFLFSLALAFSLVPLAAQAQTFDFSGSIVPEICKCKQITTPDGQMTTAPAYGCVLQTLQNVIRFAFALAFLISVLAFIYAGFMWITAGSNSEKRTQGKIVLINTVLGIFIMLAAWLVVDFIMKTLYREPTEFGPWNSILAANGASACIMPTTPVALTTGTLDIVTGQPVGSTATGSSSGSGSNCPAADPAGMVAFPAEATSGGAEKALPATVRNFLAMRAAASQEGIDLKVTDGYRPESEQVDLWNRRASIGVVAKPCTLGGNGSNHNSGEAIDINVGCGNGNSSCNTRAYNWLKANGA